MSSSSLPESSSESKRFLDREGKGRCRAEEAESNGTIRADWEDEPRALDAEKSRAGTFCCFLDGDWENGFGMLGWSGDGLVGERAARAARFLRAENGVAGPGALSIGMFFGTIDLGARLGGVVSLLRVSDASPDFVLPLSFSALIEACQILYFASGRKTRIWCCLLGKSEQELTHFRVLSKLLFAGIAAVDAAVSSLPFFDFCLDLGYVGGHVGERPRVQSK